MTKKSTPRAAKRARTSDMQPAIALKEGPEQIRRPLPSEPLIPAVALPKFRDRIKELRRVKASELQDNAGNWRRHPDEQRGAMTSMMSRLGITDAVIAYESPRAGGKLVLIDGHLRRSIAGEDLIPVLILDLTDEEADLMLATFDPLGDLALMDAEALKTLLEQSLDEDDEDAFTRRLMADVSNELAAEVETSGGKAKEIEGMALEPHEHYDYLVVLAQSSHEWNVLCDRLGLKPEQRRAKMGTARAIRATRLLEKLNAGS